MLPQYSTKTFSQIWKSVEDFMADYNNNGLINAQNPPIKLASATQLFYLLFARFGNNPIANRDITQWKYKMFSVIVQYGPTWEKKLEVQSKLRGLTDDELRLGSKVVYNTALNPSTAPSTASLEELSYINSQNVSNYKKGKLDGYAVLVALLEDDITYRFLNKFQHCFKQFVAPEEPLLFVTEEDED